MMAKYAVIIIDMLEEFVRGRLKAEAAEKIIPSILRLLEFARSKGVPIIYTVDSHYPGIDHELKLWGPHAIRGSKEAEVVKELKPLSKDYVVQKRRYDAFMFTDLDMLLRELGVTSVILAGIHTHICVQNTALGAFYRGYRVIIPHECVAAATEEWHKRGLEYIKEFSGAEIVSLDQLLKRLEHEVGKEECPKYM